ncbi:MAG: TolC family protein, partial [Janthinobacterium lividum]
MSLHARGHHCRWFLLSFFLLFSLSNRRASAQISLSTVVNLALQNSPRVKIAATDLARAEAVLAETKEAFVPVIGANGGVGRSTGAPLNPPVIFSIAAQSLVFNFSQPDYIRA